MGIGPLSDERFDYNGCMECKYASFYYDSFESMGNETQRHCKNKNNDWKWDICDGLLKICPFKETGKPDWSNYNEPKYDPDLGRWR